MTSIEHAVRATALVTATTLAACAPILSHGPRVEEGTSIGASVAALRGNDRTIVAVIPYLKSGQRYDDGTARQFTVQVVMPMEQDEEEFDGIPMGFQLDYFRERPSGDSAIAHGRGVHVGLQQVMGYGQWGRYSGRSGLYTTQGVGLLGPILGLPPAAMFWSPGAGYEYRGDGFTLRAQVSTIFAVALSERDMMDQLPMAFGLTVQVGDRDSEP